MIYTHNNLIKFSILTLHIPCIPETQLIHLRNMWNHLQILYQEVLPLHYIYDLLPSYAWMLVLTFYLMILNHQL